MSTGSITRRLHRLRATAMVGALAVLIGVSAAVPVQAQASSPQIPLEHRIKAAFLVRFVDFIVWPPDAAPVTRGEIVIGVVGDRSVFQALQALDGLALDETPLVVKRLSSTGDLGSCHILFVGEGSRQDIGKILATISGAPVLTVGGSSDFTRLGGMVRFYIESKRVRFEINNEACQNAGLKISSHLLRLATTAENDKGR